MGTRRPSSSTRVTEVASGRSARMTTPSGPGCAPSTECGSWWCPATTRSISPRLGPAGAAPGPTGAVPEPAGAGPEPPGLGLLGLELEPGRLASGDVIAGHSIREGCC